VLRPFQRPAEPKGSDAEHVVVNEGKRVTVSTATPLRCSIVERFFEPHCVCATGEERASWLLAQMLEWHRREQKSAWWEYFRICELSEDELQNPPIHETILVDCSKKF
jgi:hypothetical protein